MRRLLQKELGPVWFVEYRELIRILTISDLKVKYQSSVLGFAWSFLNPLLMMSVLYVVFANVFHMAQDHFALYLLIGIVTWRFFANGTSTSMYAILGKSSLVTKIYVPRQILVLSTVLSCLIASLLEFLVLVILLLVFGVKLSLTAAFFPLLHMAYSLFIYGISLVLAALYVYYRDLNQIWEVLLQVGFFLSPVVYPLSTVPDKYTSVYMLNPVTAVMQTYRDTLLYGREPSLAGMALILSSGAIAAVAGSLVFRRLERRFAEEI